METQEVFSFVLYHQEEITEFLYTYHQEKVMVALRKPE